MVMVFAGQPASAADPLPNACPVDGCSIEIIEVKRAGEELKVTYEANFSPDLSKNHVHIWWGEIYSVEQVSVNAELVHGVKQGSWDITDDNPSFTTSGAASLEMRGEAKSICVSPADRDHNIIDVKAFDCVDVSDQL